MGNKVKNKLVGNLVIIWGNDNSNTLGVIRQLGENNIETFVVFNKQKTRIASKSKYCKNCYVAKDLEDAYNFLINRFTNFSLKPVLLSTGDIFANYIDSHSDKLSEFFLLEGTKKQGVLGDLLNKSIQTKLAGDMGLRIPISTNISIDDDLSNLKLPIIIKPSKQDNNVNQPFKIKVCRTVEDLIAVKELLLPDSQYIAQQYIEDYKLVVVDGCRLVDGKTLFSGSLVCERGGEDGDSSFGYMTEDIPQSIDLGAIKRMLEDIDYYGPFGLDFGLKGNIAYFFEINLRIDATNYLYYRFGSAFVLLWVLSVTGHDYKSLPMISKGKKYFIDDIGELWAVYAGRMSKKQWAEDMQKAEIFKYKNKEDNGPYYWQKCIYHVLTMAKSIGLR